MVSLCKEDGLRNRCPRDEQRNSKQLTALFLLVQPVEARCRVETRNWSLRVGSEAKESSTAGTVELSMFVCGLTFQSERCREPHKYCDSPAPRDRR